MNWYPFHLGDYLSHTRHLTEMQDLAYRRILDWYYLHEKAPKATVPALAAMIGLPMYEEDVRVVLEQFFEETDGRWVNKRAEEELERYHARRRSASDAGRRSAATRGKILNDRSTTVEQPFNDRSTTVQPPSTDLQLTTTTTTTKEEESARARRSRVSVSCPEEVSPDIWEGWLAIRKAKRAPVSELALELLREEAAKVGWTVEAALKECVARGWQGFKADWVAPKAASSFGARGAGKPVPHIVNMPLGTPSCDCEDCVAYRAKRGIA